MAESLRGGLSLGLSGFGFWSHDIGGFEGMPPAELYKRWLAFGLLSSHSRLHGSSSYRVPWLFDDEAVDVLRHFTKLKCRLMPYLFARAVESARTGVPLMRAMLLEFPDDPACDFLDRQYMLGDSLLVAPVFAKDGAVAYYLPAGRWTNFLSGKVVDGPGWLRETHGMLSLPLMVRPNAVIAVGRHDDRPDYDYGDGVILQVYQLSPGRSVQAILPSVTGSVTASVEVRREGRTIWVEWQGHLRDWRLLLTGVRNTAGAVNCTAVSSSQGTFVSPIEDNHRLAISLAEAE
jgi:alpha-D-xyloside xylohydrolase